MPKPKAELAVAAPAGALAVPDEVLKLFAGADGAGLENISAEDIRIPRLAIMQPMSPAVNDGLARPGEIVNSVTGENYGNSVRLFALLSYTTRVQWESRDLNSNIECMSRDGVHGSAIDARHNMGNCSGCPMRQWGTDEKERQVAPLCTEFRNLIVLPYRATDDELAQVTNPSPAVFSGKRASLRPVTDFLGAAAVLRYKGFRPPLWACRYELTSKKESNEKGTYFLPVFNRLGYVDSPALFTKLNQAYEAAKAVLPRVAVDTQNDGEYMASPGVTAADDEEGDY